MEEAKKKEIEVKVKYTGFIIEFNWEKEKTNMYQLDYAIEIDTEKCLGCGDCVDICPVDVLELQDGKSVAVKIEDCIGCGSCAAVCEQRAISMEELWSN